MAACYYGMYIPGTLFVSGPMVKGWGYRAAFVAGLTFLGAGNFAVAGAAMHANFTGMCCGMLLVGLGVSTLERAANPYTVNVGQRDQATLRILFAQSWAGIGTVIAPIIAREVLFEDPNHPAATPLGTVIAVYQAGGAVILGIAVLAAVLFLRTRLVPEARHHVYPKSDSKWWQPWKHELVSVKYLRLWWAAVANFINIGCQVTVAQFFVEHMVDNGRVSADWGAIYMSVAQALFVVGRLAAFALVCKPKFFKPRLVLGVFIAAAVAFSLASAVVKTSSAVIACLCMVMFAEAPSFPMIFESADVDLGDWSSTGETIMIVSISGGGLLPPLFGRLAGSAGLSKAWLLVAGCFGLVLSYCLACNVWPSYRKTLDRTQCGEDKPKGDEESNTESTKMEARNPSNSKSVGSVSEAESART